MKHKAPKKPSKERRLRTQMAAGNLGQQREGQRSCLRWSSTPRCGHEMKGLADPAFTKPVLNPTHAREHQLQNENATCKDYFMPHVTILRFRVTPNNQLRKSTYISIYNSWANNLTGTVIKVFILFWKDSS